VFVEHRQHPQSSAMHGGVGNEVAGPHMPAVRRPGR
jgi:hypothetical protein